MAVIAIKGLSDSPAGNPPEGYFWMYPLDGVLTFHDENGNIEGVAGLGSELTALAALTTTSYGRDFLELANLSAARTKLDLGALVLDDVSSPAQITADQNDYDTGTACVLRLNTDATRTITGFLAVAEGTIKVVQNVGSFDIVLSDEDGSSLAANRFALSSSVTITPDTVIALVYDTTTGRWRMIGTPASSADFSSNTSSSVDNEIVLFSGTGGKTGKRATTTGILKGTSGVLSSATAGTDYYAPGSTDVAVADGGTGASTLTGLLQGNGTGAITGITNSSTVGQILRVTGTNTYAWGALDLADSDARTGTLPVANGGTGAATLTANNVLLGNGTSALQVVAPGTSGNVLTSNGTTWTSAAAGAASISRVATNVSNVGNVGSGEDTLWSVTVPTATLASNGVSTLRGEMFGKVGNTANDKRLRLKWDGTLIFDTGVFTDGQNKHWRLEVTVIRISSTSSRCIVEFEYCGTAMVDTVQYTLQSGGTNMDSGSVILLLTGESPTSGATNDLEIFGGTVNKEF